MKKILYLSAGVTSPATSFSCNFFKALKKTEYGNNLVSIVLQLYIDKFYNHDIKKNFLFKKKKIAFKMSNLPRNFDIYFIDGTKNLLINDLPKEKLVIYFHKDLFSTFLVDNPDIILYRFIKTHPLLMRLFYPQMYYKTLEKKHPFFFAIDPDRFDVVEKDIKGVSYLGPRFDLVARQPRNFIQQVSYDSHAKIIKFLRKNKISGQFKEICSRSYYLERVNRLQARIIIPADYSYETRLLYEAAYMGTVMILYIQNDDAEQLFAEYFHFRRNREYIGFSEPEELIDICKNLRKYNLGKLTRNARKAVDTYHTFDKRVEQLIKIIEEYYK